MVPKDTVRHKGMAAFLDMEPLKAKSIRLSTGVNRPLARRR